MEIVSDYTEKIVVVRNEDGLSTERAMVFTNEECVKDGIVWRVEDYERANYNEVKFILSPSFDIELLLKAVNLYLGLHDDDAANYDENTASCICHCCSTARRGLHVHF